MTVCDDGISSGQVFRIRANRFVIGRTEGDLLIPHDEAISARHAEITRQFVNGQYRWMATDLQNTNGLLARVSRTALADRAEILVGRGRYRFEAPPPGEGTVDHTPVQDMGSTRGWGQEAPASIPPALVELVQGGIGNRYVLTHPEYWIGTDATCTICRSDDPFCEPRHTRLFRDVAGIWHAEHKKSLNGLWLRKAQIGSDKGFVFQIGEQRLKLKVGG